MRRLFFVGTLMGIIVCIALVLLIEREDDHHVSWLTRYQIYNRLITDPEELMSVVFYSSSDQSFLLEKSLIIDASLSNEDNLLTVNIDDIRSLDFEENYQGQTYTAYAIDLSFNAISLTETSLMMPQCFLSLSYQNGVDAVLEIGDVYLHFFNLDNPVHLDMKRLYAVYEPDDQPYMNGLVIGLDNQTGQSLIIEYIDLWMPEIAVDSGHAKMLNQAPAYLTAAKTLLQKTWDPIGSTTARPISIESQGLYYFPIKYQEEIFDIERFPMAIHYRFQNKSYTYLIDDFLFQQQQRRLEDAGGLIRAFDYYY